MWQRCTGTICQSFLPNFSYSWHFSTELLDVSVLLNWSLSWILEFLRNNATTISLARFDSILCVSCYSGSNLVGPMPAESLRHTHNHFLLSNANAICLHAVKAGKLKLTVDKPEKDLLKLIGDDNAGEEKVEGTMASKLR